MVVRIVKLACYGEMWSVLAWFGVLHHFSLGATSFLSCILGATSFLIFAWFWVLDNFSYVRCLGFYIIFPICMVLGARSFLIFAWFGVLEPFSFSMCVVWGARSFLILE